MKTKKGEFSGSTPLTRQSGAGPSGHAGPPAQEATDVDALASKKNGIHLWHVIRPQSGRETFFFFLKAHLDGPGAVRSAAFADTHIRRTRWLGGVPLEHFTAY